MFENKYRNLVRQRPQSSCANMLSKTLILLVASTVGGIAATASDAALAFGPPPLPPIAGPPPGLAGPPPGPGGLPHPALGAPPHFSAGGPPHAGPGGPRGPSNIGGSPGPRIDGHGLGDGLQRPSGTSGYSRSASSGYGRSARYSYGRDGWRNRYHGVYVNGDYGSSYAYGGDGCYYTYSSGRHSRVLVCSED